MASTLDCQGLGPFKILAKPTSVNYTLDIPAHYRIHRTFHVSMLRHAYDNSAGVQRPPIIMIEGEEEFEVQEILNHSPAYKTRGDTNTRFLVQWKRVLLTTVGNQPTHASLCSGKAMVLLTTVGNQPAL